MLKELGPGLVTGAADDDPSGVATYTIAGAQSGYQLLWVALVTWPLMASVQLMCAHISMASQLSLTNAFLKKFSRKTVMILVLALFVANMLNVAADLSAMADAVGLLTGYNSAIYVIVFGCAITAAMILLTYKQIARVLTWMTFFLLAYILTALQTKTDWSALRHGTFGPSWPQNKADWSIIVALLGTTISPYLFFWQASQEIEEMHKKKFFNFKLTEKIRNIDILLGTFISNLIMYSIILTAANSLHANGITNIESSRQAAQALEPLLGSAAVFCYTFGLLGVGLLAIPTLVGSASFAVAEIFHWQSGLDKKWYQAKAFYMFLTVSMIVAMGIDFAKINPIKALFYSSILNGLLSPVLIIACLLVATDKALMNKKMLSPVSKFLVFITALLMTLAAAAMFIV